MPLRFCDLPCDLIETIFDALPSVYHIHTCSLVCRMWREQANKVLAKRRAAMLARGTDVVSWNVGMKDNPDHGILNSFAHAVDQCGGTRSVLRADGESTLWASDHQINLCNATGTADAGFWIGPTSTVNSICAVGPDCVAATLHAYSDPWDDSLEAQTNLERGESRHYLVVYSLTTSDDVWHVELPLQSAYQGMIPVVHASPNGERLVVVAGSGVARYRCSQKDDKGVPSAYFLEWRGSSGPAGGAQMLCGDRELFVGDRSSRPVFVFDHSRPTAIARTLRNERGIEDGVSSMCFIDKEQKHLCIATDSGSLELRCAKYGTLLRHFPGLVHRFPGSPQVTLTLDGDLLVSHRAYHTKNGPVRGSMASLVPLMM